MRDHIATNGAARGTPVYVFPLLVAGLNTPAASPPFSWRVGGRAVPANPDKLSLVLACQMRTANGGYCRFRFFSSVVAGRVERAVSGRGPFQPGVGQGKNLLPGIG